MLKITIEGATFDELKNGVVALAQSLGGTVATKPAAAGKPAATAKADAPALEYKKDVGPLILQLADKSRERAVALLTQFGVAKGTELKPGQYAEFITAANAAIEAADSDLG